MYEYHKMRPRQIVQARETMPVAYIGFGILEWHGFHNPLGLDGLKANGIACYLAERLGGLVMPPQYWADNRQEICERHLDQAVNSLPPSLAASFNHGEVIFDSMKLSRDAFTKDAERSREAGNWKLWEELVVHTLFQIETLGFRMIVPIPGHYPLFAPMDNAIQTYMNRGGQCYVFALKDPMFSSDGKAGDHAAAFETSVLMALEPDLVDLSELDEDLSIPNIGVVLGPDPRTHANREYGQKILDKFELLVKVQIEQCGMKPPHSKADNR